MGLDYGNNDGIQYTYSEKVLIYEYSAWGQVLYTNSADIPLSLNPLRYRGYVYDVETDLYYLQSRYYDPQMGRFINGDCLISPSADLLGSNMFAYCYNNPVNQADPSGRSPITGILAGAYIAHQSCSANTPGLSQTYITDQTDPSIGNLNIGLSSVGNAGCAIVATYNALITLGNTKPFSEVYLHYAYHPTGRILFGLLGFAPNAIIHYFEQQGYDVEMATGHDAMRVYSETADACIMFYAFKQGDSLLDLGAHYFHYVNNGHSYTGYNMAEGTYSFTSPYEYGLAGDRILVWGIYIYK